MATDSNPAGQGPLLSSSERHHVLDPTAKWIFAIVAGLFLVGLCLQFILAGMLHSLKSTPAPTDRWVAGRHPAPPAPPAPRLQLSPPLDLKEFRTREETELTNYGWISPTTGVIRIPIERAMDLVLREGLPARTGTNAYKLGPSSYELMQRRPEEGAQTAPGRK